MADKEEIIRTVEPGSDIQCRTCKHRLKPVKVMGETVERHTFGTCAAFENKPQGVLWNGDKCELYKPE